MRAGLGSGTMALSRRRMSSGSRSRPSSSTPRPEPTGAHGRCAALGPEGLDFQSAGAVGRLGQGRAADVVQAVERAPEVFVAGQMAADAVDKIARGRRPVVGDEAGARPQLVHALGLERVSQAGGRGVGQTALACHLRSGWRRAARGRGARGGPSPIRRPKPISAQGRGGRDARSGLLHCNRTTPAAPGPRRERRGGLPTDRSLIVQGDQTILFALDSAAHGAARNAVVPFSEVVESPEHMHTDRITPLSLWNAASNGHTARDALGRFSRYLIPDNMRFIVDDNVARHGRLRLVADAGGALLPACDDKELPARIERHRELAPYLPPGRDQEGRLRVRTTARRLIKQTLVKAGRPVEDRAGCVLGAPLALGPRAPRTTARPSPCAATRGRRSTRCGPRARAWAQAASPACRAAPARPSSVRRRHARATACSAPFGAARCACSWCRGWPISPSTGEASVAIGVWGLFGSRQEEAQRLGRILRPKADGRAARFCALIRRDTVEEDYAQERRLLLGERGDRYTSRPAAAGAQGASEAAAPGPHAGGTVVDLAHAPGALAERLRRSR
jgi:hypothetical protein